MLAVVSRAEKDESLLLWQDLPADHLILPSQMPSIHDKECTHIHSQKRTRHDQKQFPSSNNSDNDDKRPQEAHDTVVDLNQDVDLGDEFTPETKTPGEKNVNSIFPDTEDEEVIPATEALLENGHLTEASTCCGAGLDECWWSFRWDEDLRTEFDPVARRACGVAEVPVFGDGVTWVDVEEIL